ncbi:MAG: OmpA family protein [Desulfovibrio sp.]
MQQRAIAALALAALVLLAPQARAEDIVSSDDILKQLDKKPAAPGGASRSFRGVRISTTPDTSQQQPAPQASQPGQASPSPRDSAKASAEAPSVTVYLYFKSGSAELADDFSRRQLAAVGKALAALPGARFEIGGHTDALGSDAMNQALSEQRANAIRDLLLAGYGLKAGNIIAKGYGEAQPVADNDTEAGRAKNRRVVIKRLDEAPL